MRKLVVASMLFCFAGNANAEDILSTQSLRTAALPAPAGPFLLVEWNAMDLAQRRVSIRGEYIAMDGLAFGLSSQYQNYSEKRWSQKLVQLGTSVSQYYQSLSLTQTFLRGEAALFFSQFEKKGAGVQTEAYRGSTVGASFELVLGYRFVLLKWLSLAPGAGVRRVVPDFFYNQESNGGRVFSDHENLWQPRVEFSVGVGF